jgi:hypothetical protein
MMVEIGDTPITEVRLDVEAGVQIVPPDPLAARRYPLLAVPELREMVAVPLAVDTDAGDVPMTALTYVPDG